MSWPLKFNCLLLVLLSAVATADEKDHVVVVFNSKLNGSEEIAEYYAKKRGLSDEQLIGLACTPNESVSRQEFIEFIQKPLIKKLRDRGWWRIKENGSGPNDWSVAESRLHYLVLCHGIPLKIDEQPAEQMAEPVPQAARSELTINHAAVDSELALLPSPKVPISGFVPSPFYGKNSLDEVKDWNLRAVLVSRLDGPNPDACKRLIDSAITGEEHGIWGRAVIDMRGITEGSYAGGDRWLESLAEFLTSSGWNPYIDRTEKTIDDPGPFQSSAIYAGWYQESICGPMADPNFRFVPGAIAYHIHSYSAQSLRTFDRHWVGPLVARGVAATLGCVEEPYLQFTPVVDVFFKHLFYGKNFAEAAYLSVPILSWQITIVGDPLYRPFGQNFDQSLDAMEKRHDTDLPWAYLRKAGQLAAAGMIDPAIRLITAKAQENPHFLYDERLAQLYAAKKDYADSIRLWKQCVVKMDQPALKAYYLVSLARTEWDAGQAADSLLHYRKYVEQFPDHPAQAAVAAEARAKASENGMKKEADYFSRLAPPPPNSPK